VVRLQRRFRAGRNRIYHRGNSEELSPWTIAEVAAQKLCDQKMVIRQAVGEWDDTLDLSRKFHQHMTELKIAHEFIELPNVAHDTRAILDALGQSNGSFYRRALGVAGDGPAKNQ
jgi:hypothetical protein